MYVRDHPPPHFHATYGGLEATFTIGSLRVLAGQLPPRVVGLVLEWALMHRPELRENWRRAENREPLVPIAGLGEEN